MASLLAVKISQLSLRNPTILASGVLGISGSTLRQAGAVGAGAVVTKSLGLDRRAGYGNPTIVETEGGLLNAMGLPNPGAAEFVNEIKIAKKGKAPVIVSIFGSNLEEFAIVAKIVEDGGADAVEINLSCPHVEKVGLQLGQDPALVRDVVRRVKSVLKVPVIAKLSSNVSSIVDIASAAERGGADAITAINTLRAMAIDIYVKKPVLANVVGGLSGPAIRPVAMRCVYEISESVKIPIIAAGGVKDWKDAVEFLLAGASAVQIGTAIKTYGLGVFSLVNKGIAEYMRDNGYKEVSEIVGKAHCS